MSAEVYVWPEGRVVIWTGAGATSAIVAYAQSMQAQFTIGWQSNPTLSGNYLDYETGRRMDLNLGYLYTYNATLAKVFQSATAVHIKLLHSSINGTGGWNLWSGRIDGLQLNGTDKNPYIFNLQYHANQWSAFGGG